MVEPSLTIQVDIPFMTAENQHDPEVQFFADIYRYLVAGVAVDTSETSMKSLKKKLKEYSVSADSNQSCEFAVKFYARRDIV